MMDHKDPNIWRPRETKRKVEFSQVDTEYLYKTEWRGKLRESPRVVE